MNTYNFIDELWLDVLNDVMGDGSVEGSRNGQTREILGWTGRLADPRACFLFNPIRKLSPSYAAGEMLWYLAADDAMPRITGYAPSYSRFAEADGRAYGAYGPRVMIHLPDIVSQLVSNPTTRQAVIPIFQPRDVLAARLGDRKDIPCTSSLMFIVRDGKLNMITTMRSNDAWLGLPYDIFCWCHLQMLIAQMTGHQLGWYQHQVMSMHLYEKHWDRSAEAVNATAGFDAAPLEYSESRPSWHHILEAVKIEEWNREKKCCTDHTEGIGTDSSLLVQLVCMAATKFWPYASKRITKPTLRKFIEKEQP